MLIKALLFMQSEKIFFFNSLAQEISGADLP